MQYYNNNNTTSQTTTDTFQLVIIDRSDTGAGNFDFIYNYDQMLWDRGTASAGYARAGWAANATTGFELPGSGHERRVARRRCHVDVARQEDRSNSGGQLGRYTWQVRGGTAPNVPPSVTVTDRCSRAMRRTAYSNYTGAGDATATDADGTIASFTSGHPAGDTPSGTTNITWTPRRPERGHHRTADDRRDRHDIAAAPALSSPTHTPACGPTSRTVTVNSVNSTDVCSGNAWQLVRLEP